MKLSTFSLFSDNLSFVPIKNSMLYICTNKQYLIVFHIGFNKIIKKFSPSIRNNTIRISLLTSFHLLENSYEIIISYANGELFFWNILSNKCKFSLMTSITNISTVYYDLKSRSIFIGTKNGILYCAGILKQNYYFTMYKHNSKINKINIIDTKKKILLITLDTGIVAWCISEKICLFRLVYNYSRKLVVSKHPLLNLFIINVDYKSCYTLFVYMKRGTLVSSFYRENLIIKNAKEERIKKINFNKFKNLLCVLTGKAKVLLFKLSLNYLSLNCYAKKKLILRNENKDFLSIWLKQKYLMNSLTLVDFHLNEKVLNGEKIILLVFITDKMNFMINVIFLRFMVYLEIHTNIFHKKRIEGLDMDADNRLILSFSKYCFKIWHMNPLFLELTFYRGILNCCSFFMHKRLVLFVNEIGILYLLNLNSYKSRKLSCIHKKKVNFLKVFPKNGIIISTSDGGELKMWQCILSVKYNLKIKFLLLYGVKYLNSIIGVLFKGDLNIIAVIFSSGMIKVYNFNNFVFISTLRVKDDFLICATTCSDKNVLVGGSINGKIYVCEIVSGSILKSSVLSKTPILCLECIIAKNLLICAGISDKIIFLNYKNFDVSSKIFINTTGISSMLLSEKYNFIILVSFESTLIKLTDLSTPRKVKLNKTPINFNQDKLCQSSFVKIFDVISKLIKIRAERKSNIQSSKKVLQKLILLMSSGITTKCFLYTIKSMKTKLRKNFLRFLLYCIVTFYKFFFIINFTSFVTSTLIRTTSIIRENCELLIMVNFYLINFFYKLKTVMNKI